MENLHENFLFSCLNLHENMPVFVLSCLKIYMKAKNMDVLAREPARNVTQRGCMTPPLTQP